MFVAVVLGLVALALLARAALRAYRKFGGTRLITCPDNERAEAVELDARAAVLAELRGRTELRIRDCSRWPEKSDCGRECLEQIEAAPHGCLVRDMVHDWYVGKSCALCDRPFGPIRWHDHKPGMLRPDGITVDWDAYPPKALPEIFATHRPVCRDCRLAETSRRRFPERVGNRDRR